MSVGMKIICTTCAEFVYVGTMNSQTVEEPDDVGKFLWKHHDHNIIVMTEGDMFYNTWVK